MEINIGELDSTVRAVDGDALIAPPAMQRIVEAVLRALGERDEHRERVRAEQQIGGDRPGAEEGWR